MRGIEGNIKRRRKRKEEEDRGRRRSEEYGEGRYTRRWSRR